MSMKDLLAEAMKLKPEERFTLLEGLIKSLDEPDKTFAPLPLARLGEPLGETGLRAGSVSILYGKSSTEVIDICATFS